MCFIDNFKNPEIAVFYHEIWAKWHLNITQRIKDFLYTPLTLFAFRNFNLTNNSLGDSILFFSVDLTNISDIGGKEILQFYVGFENSEIERPLKLLRDFKKVYLKAGEKKSINFKINKNDLSYYNTEKKKWMNENIEYNFYVGSSSEKNKLLKISEFIYQ